MYQPPIEQTATNKQANSQTNKPQKSLADLFKSADAQERYKKLNDNKAYVRMEDIYDRPITITSYRIVQEKSQFTDEVQDFTRINFYFSDDEEHVIHECRTQSVSLTNVLESVGNDAIVQNGGVPTMIIKERKGAKTFLRFSDLSDVY